MELFCFNLIFLWWGAFVSCDFLLLNDKSIAFADFCFCDIGQNIMANSSLSIHVEFGNIFHQNSIQMKIFIVSFWRNKTKKKSIVPKRFSYSSSFEKYIQSYLPSFSIDNAEKYDLYSNKNAKYLFYKFNDWAESMEGEKFLIRHVAKTKDDLSLRKIEGRNRQFIIEKLVHSMEFKDHYQNLTKKSPK